MVLWWAGGDAFLAWHYSPHQVTELIQLTGKFNDCTLESTKKVDPDEWFIALDNIRNSMYQPFGLERFSSAQLPYCAACFKLRIYLYILCMCIERLKLATTFRIRFRNLLLPLVPLVTVSGKLPLNYTSALLCRGTYWLQVPVSRKIPQGAFLLFTDSTKQQPYR